MGIEEALLPAKVRELMEGPASSAASQKTAYDMLQRQFLASQYDNLINTPLPDQKSDPEGYQKALDTKAKALEARQKVYSPDHHANLVDSLHGLITGKLIGAQPPSASGQPQASPTTPGQPTGAPDATAGHPFQPLPPGHPLNKFQEGLDALGRHLKAFAHPIAPKPEPDWKLLATGKSPEQRKDEEQLAIIKAKEDAAVTAAKTRGGSTRPVPFGKGSISAKDAQKFSEDGMEFPDAEGKPIDVSKLPEDAKITPWALGGKIFYTIGDQVPRVITADNQRNVEPEEGALSPAGEAPTLGAARVPTVSTHQVPGMNPGEKETLTSTSTPVAPQSNTPPKAGKSLATINAGIQSGNATSKKLNKGKPVSSQAPSLPLTQSETAGKSNSFPPSPQPFAPGTFQSQGKTTKPIIGAMQTVIGNVVGDEGQRPLWDYAPMFDNPELAGALNKALTLNALTIPGTQDDPTFSQTLATGIGLTGFSQQQIHDANVSARQDVQRLGGQDAMDLFARLAAFQEDLSALRSATKASAAQGSIRTIVRASPVYNASSGQNFRDQLAATLTTGRNAMKGYPEINPAYINWWAEAGQRARGVPRSSASPQVPPPRPSNVPEGYIFKNGSKGLGWYAPTIH
jgi:hypothetical protein